MKENRSPRKHPSVAPAIPCPEQCLRGLLSRVAPHAMIAFSATFLLGLFVHMFMFVNKLPNHDDIGHLFSASYGTLSGRWFLPVVMQLDGQFSAPWLIGVLSLVMLGLAAALTVSILRIRKPFGCILTAAVLVSFPTVASTFTYMFSADAYFMSLALACLGAYLIGKYRLGILPGCVAIALSMGIYQSYFSVAAVLLVATLIFDTLENRHTLPQLLLRGVKFVAGLALGLGLYIVIVKITTWSTGLVSYMGLSEMGAIDLAQLPYLTMQAYGRYHSVFWENSAYFHFSFMKYFFLLMGLATAVLGVFVVRAKKLPPLKIAFLAVLAVLYPLGGNIIYLMVPNAEVHTLMIYGMCFLLLAPLALAEYQMALPPEAFCPSPAARAVRNLCAWVIVITVALAAYGYSIYSNEAYLKIQIAYEQSYSHSTRLLSAIEQTEGYDSGMDVVLVGTVTPEIFLNPAPALDRISATGIPGMRDFIAGYTYDYFLKYYLGFPGTVFIDGTPLSDYYTAMEQVSAMPVYPSTDSIQMIEGKAVVKISNS